MACFVKRCSAKIKSYMRLLLVIPIAMERLKEVTEDLSLFKNKLTHKKLFAELNTIFYLTNSLSNSFGKIISIYYMVQVFQLSHE